MPFCEKEVFKYGCGSHEHKDVSNMAITFLGIDYTEYAIWFCVIDREYCFTFSETRNEFSIIEYTLEGTDYLTNKLFNGSYMYITPEQAPDFLNKIKRNIAFL